MNQDYKFARTQWACRRGMLELDFIFKEFLDNGYQQLSTEQQDDFLLFLENDDPDLYSWLMGFRSPSLEQDIIMVQIIQAAKVS